LSSNAGPIIIIGAGIVGASTGNGLRKAGHDVLFVDKNPNVVKSMEEKGHRACSPEDLGDHCQSAHASMFCVDTPLNKRKGLDLDNIISAISYHAKWLRKSKEVTLNGNNFYHLIVIRSTVPPGTTNDVLLPMIEEQSGLKVGKDIGLCMQPEFLRTVSAEFDFLHPRATIIGQYDNKSGDVLESIYSMFEGEKIRVSLGMAEFMKFIHNCFNATKISFSNEMWLLGQNLGLDANSALQVVAKTAEGIWNPFYGLIGGQPYGGHCLPKDTEGFVQFARKSRAEMPLLSAVIRLNKELEKMAKLGKVKNATLSKPSILMEESIALSHRRTKSKMNPE
jgi:UDPglucose 6-dehydrogenase